MCLNIMEILCHYTKCETAIKILEELSLRFGKISNSNDPIEIKNMKFQYSGSDDATYKMISDNLNDYLNSILSLISFSHGEYSFDENFYDENISHSLHDLKIRPPFYLPRMWTLYAENHSGVCFVLKKNDFLNNAMDFLKDSYHFSHDTVDYSDFVTDDTLKEMSDSYDIDEKILQEYRPKETIQKYLEEHAEFNYFNKDRDWDDEHEYRFLIWNKKNNLDFKEKYVKIKKSLYAIVLGLNHDLHNSKIVEIAMNKNIEIFKLDFDGQIFFSKVE